MDLTIYPSKLAGEVTPPSSKSQAHRALIAAALGGGISTISNLADSQDIQATRRCLSALGALVEDLGPGTLRVHGLGNSIPQAGPFPTLDCGESGSTLRFLIPVALLVQGQAAFTGRGRLMERPLAPYEDLFRGKGIGWSMEHGVLTLDSGRGYDRLALDPGEYRLPGDVSSQFITGLLFALPLLPDGSRLVVEGARESASYLQLTLRALATFGLTPREQEEGWTIASQGYASPGVVQVEGDWSNAAPWLCLGMLGGEGVTVTGMDLDSLQGDRAVCRVLAAMGGQVRTAADRVTVLPGPRVPTRMDARDIPDLVPVLAAVAAATPGVTEITGAARLRLKESDRLETTARMLNGVGGQVEETADGLLIRGRSHRSGGQVDAAGDHRIAMAAAVASGACTGPVTITGAQAVEKSYPTFWAELRSLGKQVEETPVGP